jgi:UDP-N-acetylmuramoylalanine--D-glutamate ligase
MNYADHFAGKKITVMRIGLLGRGVGDAAFLAEAGAQVLVVDNAPVEVMQPSVDALKQYSNITFKFGPYDTADFISADYVLVGAGTPINSPELAAAKLAGVPLKQSAAWFAELSGIPIIGVTGTRGKSTVTHMIHHVLSQVTGEPVLLGGNIRGRSNLQLLNEVKPDSLCVMELDSWQLQGWGWSEMSPQIAVFTNFMEDHLNYYQGPGMSKPAAMDVYFADKANIFSYQEESGVLITTPEVFEQAKQMPGATLGQEVILADSSGIPADGLLAMPGEHNRLNAALAIAALKALSLTEEEIYPALASFSGVEGRLLYLGAPDGVGIFNDNNATTPIATVRALEAVGTTDTKNIILIAGGADKDIDPAELLAAIPQFCKQVLLLPGTGTDRLVAALADTSISHSLVDSVEAAVKAGLAAGQPGDILLFSPGYASFGLFKNEYERNDAFLSATDPIINIPPEEPTRDEGSTSVKV